MHLLLEVCIQLGQLRRRQQRLAADVVHALQRRYAALLVALEVVAHRVVVDQQRSGYLGRAPTAAEQDHGVEPICRTGVARRAMRRPQLRELLLVEVVVLHARKTKRSQRLAPDS